MTLGTRQSKQDDKNSKKNSNVLMFALCAGCLGGRCMSGM
jgi:hypothetical protein